MFTRRNATTWKMNKQSYPRWDRKILLNLAAVSTRSLFPWRVLSFADSSWSWVKLTCSTKCRRSIRKYWARIKSDTISDKSLQLWAIFTSKDLPTTISSWKMFSSMRERRRLSWLISVSLIPNQARSLRPRDLNGLTDARLCFLQRSCLLSRQMFLKLRFWMKKNQIFLLLELLFSRVCFWEPHSWMTTPVFLIHFSSISILVNLKSSGNLRRSKISSILFKNKIISARINSLILLIICST